MREWRKGHPLSEAARVKDRARTVAGVYLRRGKVEKRPCQVCGAGRSEMHHPDYGKPLEVVWLCRRHHLDLHQ